MSMSTEIPGIGALQYRSATRIGLVAFMTVLWLGWAAVVFTSDGTCHCSADDTPPAVELLQ